MLGDKTNLAVVEALGEVGWLNQSYYHFSTWY